jgi:hypothetical protein
VRAVASPRDDVRQPNSRYVALCGVTSLRPNVAQVAIVDQSRVDLGHGFGGSAVRSSHRSPSSSPVADVARAATPPVMRQAQHALQPVDPAVYQVQRSLRARHWR